MIQTYLTKCRAVIDAAKNAKHVCVNMEYCRACAYNDELHDTAADEWPKTLTALELAVGALEYYPNTCDACNFSGVDEAEFSARGCPSCDCLQARTALTQIQELLG